MRKLLLIVVAMLASLAAIAESKVETPLTPLPDGPNPGKSKITIIGSIGDYTSDENWSEWYVFDTGTLYTGGMYFFGEVDPYEQVTVMRRDYYKDSTYSQLKFLNAFSGIDFYTNEPFEGIDFVVDLNNFTGLISYETQMINATHPQSEFEGQKLAIWGRENAGKFTTKARVPLKLWYAVLKSGSGFNGSEAYYLSDKHLKVQYSLDFVRDLAVAHVSSKNNTIRWNYDPDNIVTTMKYAVNKHTDSPNDRTLCQSIRGDDPNIDIKVMIPGSNSYEVDGPGQYFISWVGYDNEGDELTSGTKKISVNAKSNDRWEDMGEAMFEPLMFQTYLSFYAQEYNAKYDRDIIGKAYPVKVQRNLDRPGAYRLVNPFGIGTPFENIDLAYMYWKADGLTTQSQIMTIHHDDDYYIEFGQLENNYFDVADCPCPIYFESMQFLMDWNIIYSRYYYSTLYDTKNGYLVESNGVYLFGSPVEPYFIITMPEATPTTELKVTKNYAYNYNGSLLNLNYNLAYPINTTGIKVLQDGKLIYSNFPTNNFANFVGMMNVSMLIAPNGGDIQFQAYGRREYSDTEDPVIGTYTLKADEINATMLAPVGTVSITDTTFGVFQVDGQALLPPPYDLNYFYVNEQYHIINPWQSNPYKDYFNDLGVNRLMVVDLNSQNPTYPTGFEYNGGEISISGNKWVEIERDEASVTYELEATKFEHPDYLPYALPPFKIMFIEGQLGVDNISADDMVAPVEYFDLRGNKVENPRRGIFIRRQGSQVTKVAR